MGIFDEMMVALEAEDITKEAQQQTGKLMKNIKPNDINDITETEETDDVSEDIDNEEEDDTKDSDDKSLDIDNDEEEDESVVDEEDNMNDENDTSEIINKKRLRRNMILFHNILTSNINLLSDYTPENDNIEYRDIIGKITRNLVDCKETLFSIITEELNSVKYVELLRKYIALNRVYDINIKILEKYFNNIEIEYNNSRKMKRKKK